MNKPIDLGSLLPPGWLVEIPTAPPCQNPAHIAPVAVAGFPDDAVDTAKPDDEEIIALIAQVYDVTEYVAIRWLTEVDLPGALSRDQGVDPE